MREQEKSDRSTWEPWDHFFTLEVQAEARKVKNEALPTLAHKLTVPVLRATLEERGLDSDGLMAALVDRLKSALA